MSKPAIVLGDVNVDMVVHLPDRSGAQVDLTKSVPQLSGGGTGGNAAVALARLGVPTAFVGAVGDDGFGRTVTAEFEREGVGTRGIITLREWYTPMVLALIQPDGERHLVVWPPERGADVQLRPEHLNADLLRGAAWLHTTGMCLRHAPVRDALLAGMRIAHEAGVPVSLDLNLRIELWGYGDDVQRTVERAVALADVVFGNGQEEIVPVSGVDSSIEDAARALSAGRRIVVARNGAAGVLAASPEGIASAPAFKTVVVNTVGAGDAFDGGFIAARLGGRSVREALRWGNAVAALKIARGGARALPTRAEVESLLATSG